MMVAIVRASVPPSERTNAPTCVLDWHDGLRDTGVNLRHMHLQLLSDIVQRSGRIHAATVVGTTPRRVAARVVDVGLQPHLRGCGVRVVAVHVNGVQTFQLAGLGGGGVCGGW